MKTNFIYIVHVIASITPGNTIDCSFSYGSNGQCALLIV